jgi:hypothetical protein
MLAVMAADRRRLFVGVERLADMLETCGATGVSASLYALARHTGDGRYARAARALFQECSAGRPAIDDHAALLEARALLASGAVRSERAALFKVARARDPTNPERMLKRLQKKSKKDAAK